MTPPVDINEIHRKFWTKRRGHIALLVKPHLVAIVLRREIEKARFVKLAVSEADRIERIRNQKPFECELESAAEEFASLPVVKAQQRRARAPRGKITEQGRTLDQVIEIFVLRPENRDFSALELWPLLFAKLDQLLLDPKENCATDHRKSAYAYEFRGKIKTRLSRQANTYRSDKFESKFRQEDCIM